MSKCLVHFVIFTLQPYFCGQEDECTRHNSEWALKRAIENIEAHFPVVGILERFDDTFIAMEHYMPYVFRNVGKLYTSDAGTVKT